MLREVIYYLHVVEASAGFRVEDVAHVPYSSSVHIPLIVSFLVTVHPPAVLKVLENNLLIEIGFPLEFAIGHLFVLFFIV